MKVKNQQMKIRYIHFIFFLGLLAFVSSCSSSEDDLSGTYTSIEQLLLEIDFQGYAIVTKNHEDILRKGFGLANRTTSLAQEYERAYRIGSVTKTFTAAGLVLLKREGLIQHFNQRLSDFDPDFPLGDQITLAQLLSHQSGIPEYQFFAEQAYEQGEVFDAHDIYETIKTLIEAEGLQFTPGTAKQYCNSNYLIAALLIEELSGITYHEYIQQFILNPLELYQTYKGTNEIDVSTHAEGYLGTHPNSDYPMHIPFGAGDFSSTPKDMEIWVNAVKSDWFSEEEKGQIFAQNVPDGYVDFGLGWFATQDQNTTLYWHGGDINGYWSMIGFIPKYNAIIVLLSNKQDDSGLQRSMIIEELLNNEFQ